MRVLEKGHRYELDHRGGEDKTVVQFVDREPGTEKEGVLTQEVLRMLIDRTRYCNNCLPHPNNERVIYHLRMALVLHEARALERKVEKGEIEPEHTVIGADGHYLLNPYIYDSPVIGETTNTLDPHTPDWERECKYTRNIEKADTNE